jgi:hypothetical protein
MYCEDRIDHLNELLDGSLAGPERMALFRHLAGCGECSDYLAVMLRFKSAAVRDDMPIPARIDDEVLRTIPGSVRSRRFAVPNTPSMEGWFTHRFSAPFPVLAAGIVACIVAGIIIARLWIPGPPAAQQTRNAVEPFGNPSAVIVVYGIPPVDVVESTRNDIIVPRQPIQY